MLSCFFKQRQKAFRVQCEKPLIKIMRDPSQKAFLNFYVNYNRNLQKSDCLKQVGRATVHVSSSLQKKKQ